MFHLITQIITMKCIGKCNYCMYGTKLNLMDDVNLDDLLNYYKQIPTEDMLDLKITGGEPLQPNNVERTINFIKGIKSHSYKLTHYQVNTNGNWGIPEYILNDDLATIQISCDGPKEYQEKNYGYIYFDELLKTLEQVRNRPNTKIMMVITSETKSYVNYVKGLANEYGIEYEAQIASPVDKAEKFDEVGKFKEMHNKYFTNISKDEPLKRYERMRQEHLRGINIFCGYRIQDPKDLKTIGYGISSEGKIVNCPILSEKESGISIYDTKPTDIDRIYTALNNAVKDCTCSFPHGVVEYIKNTTAEERKLMIDFMPEEEKEYLHEYCNFDTEHIG